MALAGFPSGSAGKESACNAGDLGSIPRWEDPLEKGKATHSSILAWRIPWTVHGVTKSWTQLSGFHFSLSGGISSKEPQVTKRPGFGPWVGKIWRRAWQPSPVFFPGESHGQRSLVGYSPWGRKESDMTKGTLASVYIHTVICCCWSLNSKCNSHFLHLYSPVLTISGFYIIFVYRWFPTFTICLPSHLWFSDF